MQQPDHRSCSCHDMGELKGDVASSDEHDTGGQRVELQELVARDEVLAPGNLEIGWLRSGSDVNVSCLQHLASHLDGRGSDESGVAVEGFNAGLGEVFLPALRNGLGERALESDQLRPVNSNLLHPDSLPLQTGHTVHGFGSSHQHLLGIASPENTGTSVRPRIDDGYFPSRLPAP